MLVKAMRDLLGDEVLAADGRVGVLEDFYFDRDCWLLCYLVVASGAARALVSMACVEIASTARRCLSLAMTREKFADAGAGAWSMESAVQWLGDIRVCSARQALGWRILAEDGAAGEIADLLVDRTTWSIDYLVASTADSFGPRQVVLPLDWADPLDPLEGAVRMRRTRAQLCSALSMNPASLLRARA